jgi:hypothetical protein
VPESQEQRWKNRDRRVRILLDVKAWKGYEHVDKLPVSRVYEGAERGLTPVTRIQVCANCCRTVGEPPDERLVRGDGCSQCQRGLIVVREADPYSARFTIADAERRANQARCDPGVSNPDRIREQQRRASRSLAKLEAAIDRMPDRWRPNLKLVPRGDVDCELPVGSQIAVRWLSTNIPGRIHIATWLLNQYRQTERKAA